MSRKILTRRTTSESVPRAVASEAFERIYLMEPRRLPFAVLKDSLATARGTDQEVVRAGRNFFGRNV